MRTSISLFLILGTLVGCRTDKSPFEEEENWDVLILDEDGDGFTTEDDCNDSDGVIYPGAEELCDGIDNDCDGDIDEDVTTTFYADTDGDGFGDPEVTDMACQISDGWVNTGNDCDDENTEVYPGASERCDGLDNDCDGDIDEDVLGQWFEDADEDGYGDPDTGLEECNPPSGFVDNGDDCNDTTPSASPEATEICDEIDNDCDGAVDEGTTTTYFADGDGDGWGDTDESIEACDPPSGYTLLSGDCNDENDAIRPDADEICNDLDDDCDGVTDTDAIDRTRWYPDADGDGFGADDTTIEGCDAPTGHVADSGDCDDTNSAINPDASEVCNELDDDCDALIDDSDPDISDAITWYIDYDGDGFGSDRLTTDSCEAPYSYVSDDSDCDDTDADIYPGAEEFCNGEDDDCDGNTDESSVDPDTFYADSDEDGYGDPDVSIESCDVPSGYTDDDNDCDDGNPEVSPEGEEICNAVDDDCDGDVDDGLLGLAEDCPALDCLEIITEDSTATDGSYWIEFDGTATETECEMSTDGGGWTLIFVDDFDSTPDPGWSISDTTTCGSWGTILGGYGVIAGDEIDITLDAYGIVHTEAWIELDYLAIDSWDGEAMYMDVDGTNVWAEAQTNHSSIYGEVCGWDRGWYGSYDSLEPVSEFITHSDNSLELVVGSTLDQSAWDESFGIDEVWIWLR